MHIRKRVGWRYLFSNTFPMAPEIISHQRVSVQKEPYCFVVVVGAQPVLRCSARQEALQYAALIRRALRQADPIQGDGAPAAKRPVGRKIPN
jgi:hypothetical protein